jgi:hypothetical protein
MKTSKAGLIFVCGAALGLSLAFCLGAADKAAETPKTDWSRLKIVTYPSGITGFFDPDTGRLYVYDGKLERCAFVRELKTLGQPLIWR